MTEVVVPHTTVTKSSGMKFAQYGNIFVAQGYIVGDGTSTINLNLPITIETYTNSIPCLVRNRATGLMSIYFVNRDGQISGWDGTTDRIFEQGKEYWITFVYVIV